ncbi:hypothetical protein MMC07_005946 [Pseudocyphellaria aurata]|nr:hypothetical protein [Pseudocyphellaria aurata]
MAPARGTKAGRRKATRKPHSATPPKPNPKQAKRPVASALPPVDERAREMHTKRAREDAGDVVGDEMVARQQSRCRDIGLVLFGFVLHDAQVEAIRTLFYEQTDLLLLAKTGFSGSLIFQLLPEAYGLPNR